MSLQAPLQTWVLALPSRSPPTHWPHARLLTDLEGASIPAHDQTCTVNSPTLLSICSTYPLIRRKVFLSFATPFNLMSPSTPFSFLRPAEKQASKPADPPQDHAQRHRVRGLKVGRKLRRAQVGCRGLREGFRGFWV